METEPTRMCELLVGLPAVRLLGVVDDVDGPLWVHIETVSGRPACAGCGRQAVIKDRDVIELVDLPAFGRRARLAWRKHRWCCPAADCPVGSWTGQDRAIAAPRLALTDRAGRWVAEQVGRLGRTVAELAEELGCDWHTVNDTVIAYGTALVDDDPDRIGESSAVGIDEVLFVRLGPWRTQSWATSIVDVQAGRLLDVVPGRDSTEPCAWFAARGAAWCQHVEWATLDLSGPYRRVFDTMLPDAIQVADPFISSSWPTRRSMRCAGGCRTRRSAIAAARPIRSLVPTVVDQGRRTSRRARTDEAARPARSRRPSGEVRTAWHAKEVVRSIYDHTDVELADAFVDRLGRDLQDAAGPPEVRQLGRTIVR